MRLYLEDKAGKKACFFKQKPLFKKNVLMVFINFLFVLIALSEVYNGLMSFLNDFYIVATLYSIYGWFMKTLL